MTDYNTKNSNLLNWAKENGAIIDSHIRFKQTPNAGISAFTSKSNLSKINEKNYLKITVPNEIIIKPKDSYNFFDLSNEKLSTLIVFKFYLAYLHVNKNNNLFFNTYIESLPELNDIKSPLLFNEFELKLLNYTNLSFSVEKKINELKKEFELSLSVLINNNNNNIHLKNIQFNDYLWAHLILTSRSFPYKIIDNNAKENDVMLLPVIDLLNHKPKSKVEWSSNSNDKFFNNNGFEIKILQVDDDDDDIGIDNENNNNDDKYVEVFNNYGPKGNEELLMGYGFVIADNEFDCLQLSYNISNSDKLKLLKCNIKLPTLSDYTFSILDNSKNNEEKNDTLDDSNMAVFMCNKFHLIPNGLLEYFALKNTNDFDIGPSLSSKLNSLIHLRDDIERRFENLSQLISFKENLMDPINYQNAKIYRKGQLDIFNSIKSEIKKTEKLLLKTFRKKLITINDILKKDGQLQILYNQINLDISNITKNSTESDLLVRLWLFKIINFNELNEVTLEIDWIINEFNGLREQNIDVHMEIDELKIDYLTDLFNKQIASLKSSIMNSNVENWNLKSWLIIELLFKKNSYKRGSNREPILIEPTIL